MSAGYFNTTRLRGDELREAIKRAEKQEAAILVVFDNAARPLSPSQVWHTCWQAGLQWPITSIRRAIHTLTERDVLRKTDQLVRGPYRMPEHLWVKAAT